MFCDSFEKTAREALPDLGTYAEAAEQLAAIDKTGQYRDLIQFLRSQGAKKISEDSSMYWRLQDLMAKTKQQRSSLRSVAKGAGTKQIMDKYMAMYTKAMRSPLANRAIRGH